MKNYKNCFTKMMIILIVLVLNQTGIAQKKCVYVESVVKNIEGDVFNDVLPENAWDNPVQLKESIMKIDLSKLVKTANEIGLPPNIEKMKMYAQKDKFRVDSESDDGGK